VPWLCNASPPPRHHPRQRDRSYKPWQRSPSYAPIPTTAPPPRVPAAAPQRLAGSLSQPATTRPETWRPPRHAQSCRRPCCRAATPARGGSSTSACRTLQGGGRGRASTGTRGTSTRISCSQGESELSASAGVSGGSEEVLGVRQLVRGRRKRVSSAERGERATCGLVLAGGLLRVGGRGRTYPRRAPHMWSVGPRWRFWG